jgi:hypothetical protein
MSHKRSSLPADHDHEAFAGNNHQFASKLAEQSSPRLMSKTTAQERGKYLLWRLRIGCGGSAVNDSIFFRGSM